MKLEMTSASGILAALGAPFVMTLGFIIWDKVWKGSAFALNLFKCCLASIGFAVLSVWTRLEGPFPSEIFTVEAVGFLMLSSTIGIVIGDLTWLESLRLIGARRVILVDTLKPFLAALFGWFILGETLLPQAFGGMALTIFGVTWVSLEKEQGSNENTVEGSDMTELNFRSTDTEHVTIHKSEAVQKNEKISEDVTNANETMETEAVQKNEKSAEDVTNANETIETSSTVKQQTLSKPSLTKQQWRRGYCLAMLNVVLDTYGSLLTKEHGVGMTTWEINLIRFGFAGVIMLFVSLIMWLWTRVFQSSMDKQEGRIVDEEKACSEGDDTSNNSSSAWYLLPKMKRRSWIQIALGVLFVTFFTPALSNYALFQIALALALTLGSVGPLYALPLTWVFHKERPTLRGCLGALVAVAGIVLLSFYGQSD